MKCGLIPARLALATGADYTACPELQQAIKAHADDPHFNALPILKDLADRDAEGPGSEEYRVLPVVAEKRPSLRKRLGYQLRACIP